MNKKIKIALNLSITTLLLAISAQFYTNYKINQTLQQFPYYFSDKLTIYVEQTKQNVFSRQLTFSIKSSDQEAKTDIVHTTLTALPFTILAKSELPPSLIRKLNEQLNITIDENIINTRFSVVGNYLQSTIETKFRDFTNVNQLLRTELSFAAKTKFVEIQTILTGFNYDSVTEFGNLSGNYLLQPIGEHRYDLIQANIKLDTLNVINGENNKFSFKNLNYLFDKSFNEHNHDVSTELKIDLLDYNNQFFIAKNLGAIVKQKGVPNYLNFYDEIKNFNLENLSIEYIITTGLDYLFNNKQVQWNISAKNLSHSQEDININNIYFNLTLDHENEQNSTINTLLKITDLAVKNNQDQLSIKDINIDNKISGLNFNTYLTILKKYILNENKLFPLKEPEKLYQEDNSEFIEQLQQLAQNYKENRDYNIKINNITLNQDVTIDNVLIKITDSIIDNDLLKINILSNIDKLKINNENISFNKFNLNIPIKLGPVSTLYPIDYCFNYILSLTCANNISEHTYKNFISQALASFHMKIENATLSVALDTLPQSTGEELITSTLNAKVETIPNKQRANFLTLGDKLEKSEITATLYISNKLIDDMFTTSPTETAKLKLASSYWNQLANIIKPQGNLNPYFQLNNENYTSIYTQKGESVTINEKPIEEYIQPIEQNKN